MCLCVCRQIILDKFNQDLIDLMEKIGPVPAPAVEAECPTVEAKGPAAVEPLADRDTSLDLVGSPPACTP